MKGLILWIGAVILLCAAVFVENVSNTEVEINSVGKLMYYKKSGEGAVVRIDSNIHGIKVPYYVNNPAKDVEYTDDVTIGVIEGAQYMGYGTLTDAELKKVHAWHKVEECFATIVVLCLLIAIMAWADNKLIPYFKNRRRFPDNKAS